MSAKFIDFLRSWGESLFTSKRAFIPEQTAPETESVDVSLSATSANTWANLGTYYAPKAGYVRINGIGLKVAESAVQVAMDSIVQTQFSGWANSSLNASVYVGKGQKVSFWGSSVNNVKAYFVSTIGGGLNTIIQAIGGGLCLLSHSFDRFISSLVAKQCRVNQISTSEVCQRQVRGAKRTPLSQMDTLSCLGFTLRQLKSRTLQNTFELNHQQVFQQVFLCLSAKAIKLTFTASTQEQGVCSLSSSRQSAQANLCYVGGAL